MPHPTPFDPAGGLRRRQLLTLCAGAAAWGAAAPVAQAATDFPVRPIRFILPWPAGGAGSDPITRTIAREMEKTLGQPVVVENRPGATGAIGSEVARRAPADGYTIVFANTLSHSLQHITNKQLPYDPLRDFAPVGLISRLPLGLMVHPSVPARTWPEFLAYAKRNSGRLNMASPGVGTAAHFFGLLLRQRAGIDLTLVPYQGDSLALNGFLAGQTQVWMSGVNLQMVREGRMVPLAMAGTSRWYKLPEVPTMVELGMPDFVAVSVSGVAAPAGTPEPVLARLNAALVSALASPEASALLESIGHEKGNGSARELWRLLDQTTQQFRAIATANNLVFD